jgi:SAM-dependent methyltransferase
MRAVERATYSGPNAEQARYWNEDAGPKWVDLATHLERLIRPVGEAALECAAVAPAERVIDVGCGCGQSTLELARRVGPRGAVLGIDLSEPMLGVARERARQHGLAALRLERGDAQVFAFERGAADLVFSRFGVMFFADPAAAFANLRAALRPGGRLVFACWRALAENPWMRLPLEVVARHVALPPPPPDGAPGPFSLAEEARVRSILAGAGFEDVALQPRGFELDPAGGRGVEGAIDFLMQMGPAGAALRGADVTDPSAVVAELRQALAPFAAGASLRMPAAVWIASARVR